MVRTSRAWAFGLLLLAGGAALAAAQGQQQQCDSSKAAGKVPAVKALVQDNNNAEVRTPTPCKRGEGRRRRRGARAPRAAPMRLPAAARRR